MEHRKVRLEHQNDLRYDYRCRRNLFRKSRTWISWHTNEIGLPDRVQADSYGCIYILEGVWLYCCHLLPFYDMRNERGILQDNVYRDAYPWSTYISSLNKILQWSRRRQQSRRVSTLRYSLTSGCSYLDKSSLQLKGWRPIYHPSQSKSRTKKPSLFAHARRQYTKVNTNWNSIIHRVILKSIRVTSDTPKSMREEGGTLAHK